MPDAQDPKQDFNPIELSIQAHGAGISSLGDRVTALEQNLKDPKLLAKTIEEAADESTRLKKLFSKVFCEMMKNDDDVKASVQEKIATIDREAVNAIMKKFGGKIGFFVWTVGIMLLSAWIGHKFGK